MNHPFVRFLATGGLALLLLPGPAFSYPAHQTPRPCLAPPVPARKSGTPPLGGPASRERTFDGYRLRTLGTAGATPTGLWKVLAIRVDFEDEPMDSTTAYFQRLLYFQNEFYEQVSGGQIHLEHTVTPRVYRMPLPLTYYGFDDSIGVRQAVLAYDAVQAADPDWDFGKFDQVLLFHAGPGQESDVLNNTAEQVWSAFFRTDDFGYYLPRPFADRGLLTADRTAAGDTVFVPSVAFYPETESQDGYTFSVVGVVCHEFGHALGLPDLYDTIAPENQVFAESQGIGSWDLMAAGTWNANGYVPGEFSAWSKVFLGWIDPAVVSQDTDVMLSAVELDRNHGIVKVPIGGDEYFLIENRLQDPNLDGKFNYNETDSTTCVWQKSGNDSSRVCLFDFYRDNYTGAEWDWWLPGEGTGSGLLIWHVDESVMNDNLRYNTVNADPNHKALDLEEADGIQDMDNFGGDRDAFGSPWDTFRSGWASHFGPDTEPNTNAYYDIPSGITIDQISAPGAGMTFRVRFAGRADHWPVSLPAPLAANHLAAGQLDDDSPHEVAAADRAGHLCVLDPDGRPAWGGGATPWFRDLATPVGAPLVADVTGDGIDDLLVAADDGRIFGFAGPDGHPLGGESSGLLVQSSNPMPGVSLWAYDIRPGLGGLEFGFGGAIQPETGLSRVEMYGIDVNERAVRRGVASLHTGSGALPLVVVDVDGDGRLELLASTRGDSANPVKGHLELIDFDYIQGNGHLGGAFATAPLPDTAYYSAPVVADLDRDGRLDAVVTSSDGNIYALAMDVDGAGTPTFTLMPGWPQPIYASGDDELSLADVDGNGYPEVLALETGGVFHVFNYHGVSLVGLPEHFPAETRYFIEPQHAPLVADLTADGRPEFVLPADDGQIFGMDVRGRRVGAWNFMGGGRRGAAPVLEDLDGDGTIELINGHDWLDGCRIDTHSLGRAAGPPAWGMYRRSGAHDAIWRPLEGEPVVNGPTLTDVFVMPNPIREMARFHYRVGDGVESVDILIHDMLGRPVRRLTGPAHPGTDNIVDWNLVDQDGGAVAPGVYLARVETRGVGGARAASLKIAVLR